MLAHVLRRFPEWGEAANHLIVGVEACHLEIRKYRLARLDPVDISDLSHRDQKSHEIKNLVKRLASSSVGQEWADFSRQARLRERYADDDLCYMAIDSPSANKPQSNRLHAALIHRTIDLDARSSHLANGVHDLSVDAFREAKAKLKQDKLRFVSELADYRRLLGVDEAVVVKNKRLCKRHVELFFATDDDQLTCGSRHLNNQPLALVDDVSKDFQEKTEERRHLLSGSSKLYTEIKDIEDDLQALHRSLAKNDNLFQFLYQHGLQGNQRKVRTLRERARRVALQLDKKKGGIKYTSATPARSLREEKPRPTTVDLDSVGGDLNEAGSVKEASQAARPLRPILENGQETSLMTRKAADEVVKTLAERILDKGTFSSIWDTLVYHCSKHRQGDGSVESWLNAARRTALRLANKTPRLGRLLPCLSDIRRSLWHVHMTQEGIYIVYTNDQDPRVVSFERRARSQPQTPSA